MASRAFGEGGFRAAEDKFTSLRVSNDNGVIVASEKFGSVGFSLFLEDERGMILVEVGLLRNGAQIHTYNTISRLSRDEYGTSDIFSMN
jgi:hypothetical protein